MRTRGSGTIERRGGGVRARISIGGELITTATVSTREEAEQGLAALRDLVASRRMVPTGALTLGLFARGNQAELKRVLKVLGRYVLCAPIGDLPIKAIVAKDLYEWLDWIAGRRKLRQLVGGVRVASEKSITVRTQRGAWHALRAVFDLAIRKGIIDRNPVSDVRPRFARVATEKDEETGLNFLTEQEVDLLIAARGIDPFERLSYLFAIGTGMRQSEIRLLRWCDVDLPTGKITLSASATKGGKRTGKRRTFLALPLALEALRAVQKMHAKISAEDPIWGREIGGRVKPFAKGYHYGWLDRSRGRQGVSVGNRSRLRINDAVNFHGFRHTTIVGLLSGYRALTGGRKWTVIEVASWVGHSTSEVTEKYYAHLPSLTLGNVAAAESRDSVVSKAREQERPTKETQGDRFALLEVD